MSNKPKEWGYKAAHHRNSAADYAMCIAETLEPLITEDRIFTQTEIDLRVKRAYAAAQKIIQHMQAAGAPIEPK